MSASIRRCCRRPDLLPSRNSPAPMVRACPTIALQSDGFLVKAIAKPQGGWPDMRPPDLFGVVRLRPGRTNPIEGRADAGSAGPRETRRETEGLTT